uniref:Ret finger protein like 4A n=1 Tax=Suricata suricatta TaxID=37032 RepID=A0A673V868_SURSU
MATQFKDITTCPVCLTALEAPMYLKCGFACCLQCLHSLRREPGGDGLLCPSCPVVSQEEDIRPGTQLGRLVAKIKELEPQLEAVLQMNPKILKFRAEVTLDVETANSNLVISEDLRSVHCGCSTQNWRPGAERFNSTLCVLGSPGFSSGRHYWEVDVGRSEEWDMGVCRASANRQGSILLSSELGFWTVGGRNSTANTMPMTALSVSPRLHRVGIFLDVDFGTVSFYHVGDGSHIFTFSKIPAGETLRPFFAPAFPSMDGAGVLRICPVVSPGAASPAVDSG